MLEKIKNIIFDLGGVIVNIDVNRTIKGFQDLGIKKIVNDTGHHYNEQFFYDFEKGQITKEDFIHKIQKISSNNISKDQIINAWNAMLLDVPADRVDTILHLKKKYKLFLLSNTNCIHQEQYLSDFKSKYGYDFNILFQKTYYSHEIGMRKPDVNIYQHVLEDSSLIGEESVFLDDSKENVEGAQKAGIIPIHIENYNMISICKKF